MAISAVLNYEEASAQLPIYYVNHFMVLAKTRYLNIEKLAFPLLMVLWKVKSYF